MKAAVFEYHAPGSLDEATELLSTLGDGAKVLAGGQSLIPMLALRLATFEHLVDLRRLRELTGIEPGNDSIWIGAGTTEAAIERSSDVAGLVPLLTLATPLIGHIQIRNRGTIGGSLAHADPAAEYPAVALALDAELEVASTRGRRTVPASGFFDGVWATDLEGDEILTGVRFPLWTGARGFGIEEFTRRHGDFAIAGAAIGIQLDSTDRIQRCAIGLIGVGATPERARAVEMEVAHKKLADIDATELGQLAISTLDSVPSDLHGSSAYRKRVGAAMVSRAWISASKEVSRCMK